MEDEIHSLLIAYRHSKGDVRAAAQVQNEMPQVCEAGDFFIGLDPAQFKQALETMELKYI